jgi:hypothetical protein
VAVEMQEVEGVKDQTHPARPIGRSLGVGKARKAVLAAAAQFTVEIGDLRARGRKRLKRAWIFSAPVETDASEA